MGCDEYLDEFRKASARASAARDGRRRPSGRGLGKDLYSHAWSCHGARRGDYERACKSCGERSHTIRQCYQALFARPAAAVPMREVAEWKFERDSRLRH